MKKLQKLKKGISLLLSASMLAGMISVMNPGDVSASSDKVETITTTEYCYSEEYDVFDQAAAYSLQESAEASVTTLEEARKFLQENLVKRVSNIKLTLSGDALKDITKSNYGAKAKEIYADSIKHITCGEEGYNPKLGDYYLRTTGGYIVRCSCSSMGEQLTQVGYEYSIVCYTDGKQEEFVNNELDSIYTGLGLNNGELTELQKVFLIYDWIVDNISYDYDNLNDSTVKTKYTAYGALSIKKAVCQGFAGLFYRMCMDNGIDCRIVVGNAGEPGKMGPHAWNIVRIDGTYYYLDSTWDCVTYQDNAEVGISIYKPGTFFYFLRNGLSDHVESTEDNVTSGYNMTAENLSAFNMSLKEGTKKETFSSGDIVLSDVTGNGFTTEELGWYRVNKPEKSQENSCMFRVTLVPAAVGMSDVYLKEQEIYLHGLVDEAGICEDCNMVVDKNKNLSSLVEEAKDITRGDYSEISYNNLQKALVNARNYLECGEENDSVLDEIHTALVNAKNNLKIASNTVNVSCEPENAGILSGGGKFGCGEIAVLKARAVSGYTFAGWYVKGSETPVSVDTTYEMEISDTPDTTQNIVAKYTSNEDNKLSVSVGKGKVAYNYQNIISGVWTEDVKDNAFAKGTHFTLTAQPEEGYTFLYWINSSGRVLTHECEYSFYLGDNTELTACYKAVDESKYHVIFKDLNGRILSESDASVSGTDEYGAKYAEIAAPVHGIFTGYEFEGWQSDDQKNAEWFRADENGKIKVRKDTTIYARYRSVAGLELRVNGESKGEYCFADEVTVTAEKIKNDKFFSGWYMNDVMVSDKAVYTFYITGDTSLEARYEGNSLITPQAMINMSMGKRVLADTGMKTMNMNVNWSLPEGNTFIGAGIILSLADNELALENVGKDGVVKVSTRLTVNQGLYSYTLYMNDALQNENVYARGYVTYMDDISGKIMTKYSDKFVSFVE